MSWKVFGLIVFVLFLCAFHRYAGEVMQHIFLKTSTEKPPESPDQWSQPQYSAWRNSMIRKNAGAVILNGFNVFFTFLITLVGFHLTAINMIKNSAEQQEQEIGKTPAAIVFGMCVYYISFWPVLIIMFHYTWNVFDKRLKRSLCKTLLIGILTVLLIVGLNVFCARQLKSERHFSVEICSEAKDNCAFIQSLKNDSRLKDFKVYYDNESRHWSAFGYTNYAITKQTLMQSTPWFKAFVVSKVIDQACPIVKSPLLTVVYAVTLNIILVASTLLVHYTKRAKRGFWKSGIAPYVWMILLAFAITECIAFGLRWQSRGAYLRAVAEYAPYADKSALINYFLSENQLWAVSPWVAGKLAATRPPLRDIIAAIQTA